MPFSLLGHLFPSSAWPAPGSPWLVHKLPWEAVCAKYWVMLPRLSQLPTGEGVGTFLAALPTDHTQSPPGSPLTTLQAGERGPWQYFSKEKRFFWRATGNLCPTGLCHFGCREHPNADKIQDGGQTPPFLRVVIQLYHMQVALGGRKSHQIRTNFSSL